MSTVETIKPKLLILEYRQQPGDEHYGSCLWARFIFNLDRYELTITSDCGNYGYKWVETPNSESFLQLMARCDEGYMMDKLYGHADMFDYHATRERLFKDLCWDDFDSHKLDEIFEAIDDEGATEDARDFMDTFQEVNAGYFDDVWGMLEYTYPPNAIKICSVFENEIKPKINEILVKDQIEQEEVDRSIDVMQIVINISEESYKNIKENK